MDAKPQRPVRPARARADENAPMEVNKSIHQRYKSTGALTGLGNAGSFKGAAKRTAFGDVSNTVRSIQSSKDDSVLPGKIVTNVVDKPMSMQFEKTFEKATAPLLRPAQRPLSISTVKGVSSNLPISTSASTTAAKPVANEMQAVKANTRKQLTKSKTAVFKDTQTSERASTSTEPITDVITSLAPVHQTLVPRQEKTQPEAANAPPNPRAVEAEPKPLANTSTEPASVILTSPVEIPEDTVKATESKQHTESSSPEVEEFVEAKEVIKLDSVVTELSEEERLIVDQVVVSSDIVEEPSLLPEAKHKPAHVAELPPVSELNEQEEYWEDEEDEENYDDEGYTTARSYRSRGDNTTGGVTTVLFPKVTAKVKKELLAAQQLVELSRTVEEIEDESWDTSMVAEYGEEIFQYMRDLEIKMLPNAHYMDNQAEIQWSMRSVLMDWLVQVHHRFSLLPETLFLCVNYIDRFLSCKIVSLGKLQLVGATAIFVAAKYEEINCPSVQEIVYMVDGGYTVDEILKAERFMLSMLQFELGWPGPMSFLRRISKADDYDLETRTLAKYFLEVTLMDERFVGSPPSFTAAGAHCLARLMLKKGDWTPAHVYYSNYTYTQLRPLLHMMVECCEDPQKHHAAVYDKYCDRRYKRASVFTAGEMQKGFKLPEVSSRTSNTSAASVFDISYPRRESGKRLEEI
ncbi:MAG: hypothetical protein M4579_004498 [Chaenotheca gracillima]|nr:MAG: hypothetical protein M4579_004498 [Chaenotheca gracillima]